MRRSIIAFGDEGFVPLTTLIWLINIRHLYKLLIDAAQQC